MRLYLIRHGNTGVNESRKRQSPETPLSKEGITEAEKVSNWLFDKNVDLILASPWKRTKQTAEIVANKLNKKIVFLEILLKSGSGEEERKPTKLTKSRS